MQVEEPLYFVDFLREPVTDAETGEVINAHPSHYEAVHGGLPDVRKRVEALQVRLLDLVMLPLSYATVCVRLWHPESQ